MVLLLLLSKDCCCCWKKNLQFVERCKQFEGSNEEEELWIIIIYKIFKGFDTMPFVVISLQSPIARLYLLPLLLTSINIVVWDDDKLFLASS